jgi:hypothetical protein
MYPHKRLSRIPAPRDSNPYARAWHMVNNLDSGREGKRGPAAPVLNGAATSSRAAGTRGRIGELGLTRFLLLGGRGWAPTAVPGGCPRKGSWR